MNLREKRINQEKQFIFTKNTHLLLHTCIGLLSSIPFLPPFSLPGIFPRQAKGRIQLVRRTQSIEGGIVLGPALGREEGREGGRDVSKYYPGVSSHFSSLPPSIPLRLSIVQAGSALVARAGINHALLVLLLLPRCPPSLRPSVPPSLRPSLAAFSYLSIVQARRALVARTRVNHALLVFLVPRCCSCCSCCSSGASRETAPPFLLQRRSMSSIRKSTD